MKILISAFVLLFSLPAFAKFEIPGLELVYTAPVETKLEAPDLRSATEVWVEMIDSAKKTLDFEEMYAISKPGEPLEKVMAAIERASRRGVKVRFMVEQKMLRASSPETLKQLQTIEGLTLRVLDFSRRGTDGIIHAKFFVVDGKEVFIGSQNFDWRSLKHIHETGLRVTDAKIVRQVSEIFESDWSAAEDKGAEKNLGNLATRTKRLVSTALAQNSSYLVASPPSLLPDGVIPSEAELVRLIGAAKEEIRVQLLDYSAAYRDKRSYPVIDNALRAAAARGVKVKLMVSHWSTEKPAIDFLKSLSLLRNVEVRIVTIPVAKEGRIPFARVNHSKIMTVDRKIGWVGTSNWSGGYLDKLRNLEVVVKDEKFADRLAQLHEQLWSSEYSVEIDPARDYPKPDKGGN